jgi:hypothetical protein
MFALIQYLFSKYLEPGHLAIRMNLSALQMVRSENNPFVHLEIPNAV